MPESEWASEQPPHEDEEDGLLACVVLAHEDPVHVRRLIAALAPFPVMLHCDAAASKEVFADMTRELPDRCVLLDRQATGWARWENVAAEIEGYREALKTPATHIAVLTGSDYPLQATAEIAKVLGAARHQSITAFMPLPYDQWGPSGGFNRLRYRHWAVGKRMLRLPLPRRLPPDVVFAGGSQLKVLSREHAATVVRVADEHPELVKFFRQSWIPDETFVGSVLSTPRFCPGWSEEHIPHWLWYIGWDGLQRKSPPWLGLDQFDTLAAASSVSGEKRMFARKFSTRVSSDLLDLVDHRLRKVAAIRTTSATETGPAAGAEQV